MGKDTTECLYYTDIAAVLLTPLEDKKRVLSKTLFVFVLMIYVLSENSVQEHTV